MFLIELSRVTSCLDIIYRPPPAQAQAQPAQAQAQAQERPPPPPVRPPYEPVDGLGGGLVTFVTRLVKSVTLPMTRCENVCMPEATEEAKSAPGRRGTDGKEGVEEGEGIEVPPGIDRPKVGSYRGHHIGTKTGPVNTRRVRSL